MDDKKDPTLENSEEPFNITKKQIVVVQIFLVLLIGFSIAYLSVDSYETSEVGVNLEYNFSTSVSKSANYEVYLPIPNMPHEIEYQNGDFKVDIKSSPYGDVYRINATGPISLKLRGSEKRNTLNEEDIPGEYYGFSTQNDTSRDGIVNWRDLYHIWIFSSQEENYSVRFEIRLESYDAYGGTNRDIEYSGDISSGWQFIEFEESAYGWDGAPVSHQYAIICIIAIPISLILILLGILYLVILVKRGRSNISDNGDIKSKNNPPPKNNRGF